jgi:hypothetical protein
MRFRRKSRTLMPRSCRRRPLPGNAGSSDLSPPWRRCAAIASSLASMVLGAIWICTAAYCVWIHLSPNWSIVLWNGCISINRFGLTTGVSIRSLDQRDRGLELWDWYWDETLIVAPLWPFALALLALGLLLRRSGRRVSINACSICGYDLRGSPGRCPECGCAREMSRVRDDCELDQ